jgi:hydrogenase assembly chaperone HypC/HupF
MCIAYPAQVMSIEDSSAIVEAQGRLQRIVLLALEANLPAPGDWLLVQSGLALAPLSEDEAVQRIRLLHEAHGGVS